ncbi:MAG: hypothetical protein ACXWAT_00530 [Methylobacter sp.]
MDRMDHLIADTGTLFMEATEQAIRLTETQPMAAMARAIADTAIRHTAMTDQVTLLTEIPLMALMADRAYNMETPHTASNVGRIILKRHRPSSDK